jgi:phage-related protein
MVEVKFYRRETGTVPVQEYLDGLNGKVFGKMVARINELEQLGHMIRFPKSESLSTRDGLFSLRMEQDKNIYRIIYFWCDGKAVCLHGFVKKDQRIRESDIDIAMKRKADYLARKDGVLYVRS